jgi:hypothetical protein
MLRERFAITHVTLQPDWPLVAPGGRRVIPVVMSDDVAIGPRVARKDR